MRGAGLYLITYDIVKDRTRVKVSKILEDYGVRVQYSVFESDMDEEELKTVLKKLKALINPAEDNIKFYNLCANCTAKTLSLGVDKSYTVPDVIVA